MSKYEEIKPTQEEIEEARHRPNGWVYRISGGYDPNSTIPAEAIIGAWKVDVNGVICGNFLVNPKFKTKGVQKKMNSK